MMTGIYCEDCNLVSWVVPPMWRCPVCNLFLCEECLEKRQGALRLCPNCHSPAGEEKVWTISV